MPFEPKHKKFGGGKRGPIVRERVMLKNLFGFEVIPENRALIKKRIVDIIKDGTKDEFLRVAKLMQDGEPREIGLDKDTAKTLAEFLSVKS